jgi:competence protein ComEC
LIISGLVLGMSFLIYHVPSMTSIYTYLRQKDETGHTHDVNNRHEHDVTSWQVVFFDVGQGLSVLVRRNKHAILYDTGAAYPSGFTLSEAVILPYLQYSAIDKLDKVILSHSDNDHAGGINSLIDNIKIDGIISNDKNITDSKNVILTSTKSTSSNIAITDCNPSQSFTWQGLTFDILWPLLLPLEGLDDLSDDLAAELSDSRKQKNDDSCVILISDQQGHKLLLTGDISSKVEQQLLVLYPLLSVDTLQVPHHGSKTSSSQAFLSQLAPKIAVVSAGYLNRWYMPVTEVRQRYYDGKITLLNSAELGQIIMTIDEKGIRTQSYVDDLRPFWFSH